MRFFVTGATGFSRRINVMEMRPCRTLPGSKFFLHSCFYSNPKIILYGPRRKQHRRKDFLIFPLISEEHKEGVMRRASKTGLRLRALP
jgi:hypothetical protein